ncbi:MAG TPA: radical SAM family heme chaperone HemW [Bacillota bacterium]|nr:radical SAM family heme chaperone HemW [Bacillota bacterium]
MPFCTKKCDYCGFNSYPLSSFHDAEGVSGRYLEALIKEAEIRSACVRGLGGEAVTLYLGGGTPTSLSEKSLVRLITEILKSFHVAHDIEITVEANPETLDYEKLRCLKDIGVTRLSIGVQSLDDLLLKKLGRSHSAYDFVLAFRRARAAGFRNINMDLIYGIPGQTVRDWNKTLDRVLALRPEHVSAYGLMLEEDTLLWHRVKSGFEAPCDEDLQIDMYYLAKDRLEQAGYKHYEISNFAMPGYESRHNTIYWKFEPYIGLGAGAHSYVNGERWSNLSDPVDYANSIFSRGSAVSEREAFSKADEMSTVMIMGLRMVDGVCDSEFSNRFGVSIDDAFGEAIGKGVTLGLLEWDGTRLRLTKRGLMLSNEAMREFL